MNGLLTGLTRCLHRPPGAVPELHRQDGVVLGAGRGVPEGVSELPLLDLDAATS